MKASTELLSALAILVCAASSAAAAMFSGNVFHKTGTSANLSAAVTGDYVEARTASVFAGACHYNGELVTTGRDAIMAWNFSGGSFHGIDLHGVRAVAAVTSDANLGYQEGTRKAELTVDSAATEQQVTAVAALLHAKCGDQLGEIVAIRRAPITFSHTDTGYAVNAEGFCTLDVSYRTDNSCCVSPASVWYSPLTPLEHRMVGYTELAKFTGSISDQWLRSDEDSAFYGAFSF